MDLENDWLKHPVIRLDMSRGGATAAAAQQIRDNNYLEPFRGDVRKPVGLAIELDDLGKGLVD